MENLGATYLLLYKKGRKYDSVAKESSASYDKAIGVYWAGISNDPECHDYAEVVECIGNIYSVLYKNTNSQDYWGLASSMYNKSKDIYSRDVFPLMSREIDEKLNSLGSKQIKGHQRIDGLPFIGYEKFDSQGQRIVKGRL
jgi:hypothetical protein